MALLLYYLSLSVAIAGSGIMALAPLLTLLGYHLTKNRLAHAWRRQGMYLVLIELAGLMLLLLGISPFTSLVLRIVLSVLTLVLVMVMALWGSIIAYSEQEHLRLPIRRRR